MASFNRYSVACGLFALVLAGCTTQTVAERKAQFDAAHAAPTSVVVKQNGSVIEQDGLQHTADGYPSFNGPLKAANAQIDDKQAMDIRTRLTALGAQKKAGTITQAQYDAKVAEMKKLAAGQQDTLSEIQK